MKVKNLIISLFILLITVILNLVAYFAAFAITVFMGEVKVSDAETATVNQSVFNIIRYALILIIMGWWYARKYDVSSKLKTSSKEALRFVLRPLNLFLILLGGLSIQLGTSAILHVLSNIFIDFFADYNELIKSYSDSTSFILILTTITIGPLAEEIVFRGLIMRYCISGADKKTKNACIFAVIVQAILFAIYHGNLIQGCYAFLFGLLFGLIAIKTDSLIPSTLLHMVVNGSLYLIPVSIYSKTIPAILISVISIAILIITCISLFKLYNRYISSNDETTDETND